METQLSPFIAPRRKLARAQRHIEELERAVEEYFQSRWYACDFDPDGGRGLHLTVFGTPRDADLIIGDTVHNLRAALDLAVVEAVRCAGGNDKGVYFPFCDKDTALDGTMRRRNLHRAPPEVQELIRRLKPYPDGNPALRALHDLDIQDKHRMLIPVAADITTPKLRVVTDDSGAPVGFREGRLKVELDPLSRPRAVFTFPSGNALAGQSMTQALRDVWQAVSAIVDSIHAACGRYSDSADAETAKTAAGSRGHASRAG